MAAPASMHPRLGFGAGSIHSLRLYSSHICILGITILKVTCSTYQDSVMTQVLTSHTATIHNYALDAVELLRAHARTFAVNKQLIVIMDSESDIKLLMDCLYYQESTGCLKQTLTTIAHMCSYSDSSQFFFFSFFIGITYFDSQCPRCFSMFWRFRACPPFAS